MNIPFADRESAGEALADALEGRSWEGPVLVLALPRGGVPVAARVAQRLDAPLDVMLVRKLGLPGQPELAMGAIATGGVRILHDEVTRGLRVPETVIEEVARSEEAELVRRERAYRGTRPAPDIPGHTVILVDDGLATGSTMRAAIAALHRLSPAAIVVAVPVAPPDTAARISREVDDLVCLATPEPFMGVGRWYRDFAQTTDEEVRALLGAEAPADAEDSTS
jgi:putative phosphoribosyl transferase